MRISDWSSDVCSSDLIIPDVEATIVDTLNEVRRHFDYVFTTGGIGPTHDDITADCVAKAFGRPLVVTPEARAILEAHRSEEHTSELQSLMRISYAVFCLKKKNKQHNNTHKYTKQ